MRRREGETLAVFGHGLLAGIHLLGVVFNLNRKKWVHASIHLAAVVYDGWSVVRHARR